MSNPGWSQGYVTDTIYADRFFRELSPAWLNYVAALCGAAPRHLDRSFTYLDLGCGFGWFCRWARAQGASRVLGLDVSEKMLARAQGEAPDPNVSYARADLERFDLPVAAFDLSPQSTPLLLVPKPQRRPKSPVAIFAVMVIMTLVAVVVALAAR